MRDPKLLDHTDWKAKKVFTSSDFLFSLKILVYSEEQKKVYTRPQMFCFPLKVTVKRKKGFIVRDEAPHFLRGPRFQSA